MAEYRAFFGKCSRLLLLAGLLLAGLLLALPAAAASPADVTQEESISTEDVLQDDRTSEEDGNHVTGIRSFSVIEGMSPDPMAGVEWDETVELVVADMSAIDFLTPGTYPLTYSVIYKDGRREEEPITVSVYTDLEHYLYGMEGSVKILVGGSFDPMEHIVYEEEIASVTADASSLRTDVRGDYLIPYILTAPDGRVQSTVRLVTVTDHIEEEEQEEETQQPDFATVTDLGLWRLTAYMDTPEDQGPYVGQTASGAPLVAGRTVAVSAATCRRLGLRFGDRLMIDGHIYVLEDHGGSAMHDQNWVDIFVDNPGDEYSDRFNRYTEVYLLR